MAAHKTGVNVIPEVSNLLSQPELLCHHNGAYERGRWLNSDVQCRNLSDPTPSVSIDGEYDVDSFCDNHQLLLLPASPSSGTQLVGCSDQAHSILTSGVALKLPTNLLSWKDADSTVSARENDQISPAAGDGDDGDWQRALAWRFPVLVTSLSPLRVYLHPEGVVWDGLEAYLLRKPHRSLSLLEIQQIAADHHGDSVAAATVGNIEEGVGASSLSGHLSSLSEYLMRQTSLNDLSSILGERRNVSSDLARGLVDLGLSTVDKGTICNTGRRFCLGSHELTYLLDSLREHSARTGLLQTEQTKNSAGPPSKSFTSLSEDDVDSSQRLTTARLHSLLLGLESFYLRASDNGQTESFEDVNIPIDQTNQQPEGVDDIILENDSSGRVITRPALSFKPEFSPLRTEYSVEVNHSVQMVTVWAWSQNCQSQARLEDKHNTDRFANFTLGLGSNTLRIFVVDTTHDEPWVLNTYTITVVRHEADYGLGPFLPGIPHVVCSLKQDCSLPFAPKEPCGLQPVTWVSSWSRFISHRDNLPVCDSGDTSGRWYVPCTSCRDDDGRCYWHEAVWSSTQCKEPVLPQSELQRCFSDKKVLFIGDSTNRGILHYLLQRVNGSLQVWDKTHHLRVYPALNNNSTLFSFAYYPQFWLPAQHRPVFDKALYQLIRKTLPLDNSSNTVVVVGGVHWLAKHHLKVVQTALAREGLTGAQVVVKGLGSGFHQPVSGVHRLSQKEQEKLLWHNQHVLRYARQQGMEVVDTFNMTMARYSHFLQGRCTCHFHRITPQKIHKKADGQSSTTTYAVEGDINAAYAEKVINRICK
ncbi:hypothetical protein BaRGS_00015143 [Batillaria attramentaria]|uniref:Cadherin-like beta sandwich domain-containing protein n=1 Tax=Batillaria attramentaria TaxID=370345 RepID=A0ABD0L288_9CAEN